MQGSGFDIGACCWGKLRWQRQLKVYMLPTFIDFTKAYDRVVTGKPWLCLEQLGVNGRFLRFLKALYQDSSCRVKVHDKLIAEFGISIGLSEAGLRSFTFTVFVVHHWYGVVTRLHEGKSGSLALNIDGLPIAQVRVFKFLDVQLNNTLTWSDHVNKICLKVSRNLNLLRHISWFLPQLILILYLVQKT